MKHKASKIVALTILYIIIIFGIFMIQFTIGKTFSYKIGSINISGRHNTDKNGKTEPLLPLHLVSNGLNFYVTEQSPILLEVDGKKIPLKIIKYEKTAKSFKILCSKETSIEFSIPRKDIPNSVKIEAFIPNNAKNIYFPWKLTPSSRLERTEKNIFLRYSKQKFVFKGASGFENYEKNSQTESPKLILSKRSPVAYYEAFTKSKKMDFESIPEERMASTEKYKQTISNFKQAALNYFEKAIDSKSYGEDLAVAYLAEMASKNQYAEAIRKAPAKQLSKQEKTYKSCNFYNNLTKNKNILIAKNNKKLKEITNMIAENNPTVFNEYRLIPFLMDNARQKLIPKLESLALSLKPEDLNADIAIGIMELDLDFSLFFPNKKNKFKETLLKCQKEINDSLLFIDDALYISSNEKSIDTVKTLKQAKILIRYGKEMNNKEIWRFVGQMLFSSILSFSGDAASIPAFFNIQRNKNNQVGLMANDNLILHADRLYPLVVSNKNYPHRENLSLQSEPGIWAWTTANKIDITENTARMFSFKVSFKKGQSHYLIIRGIRPFYRIKIYGLNYKSDPRFENYNSSGYIYDSRTRTLLLKLQHQQESEEITLFLGRPPRPKPLPVPKKTKETEEENKEENADGTTQDNVPDLDINLTPEMNKRPGTSGLNLDGQLGGESENSDEGDISDSDE